MAIDELSLSPEVAARVKCLTKVLHSRVIRAFFPYDKPRSAMENAADKILEQMEDRGDYSHRWSVLESAVREAFCEIGTALGHLTLDAGLRFDLPEIILRASRDRLYKDTGVRDPWARLPNYRRAALARGFQAGRDAADLLLGTSTTQPLQQSLGLKPESAGEQTLPFPSGDAKAPELKVWEGTVREFGDYVLDLWKKGEIQARNRTDALRQMCDQYQRKNGRRLVPRYIIQTLNARKDEQTPKPTQR